MAGQGVVQLSTRVSPALKRRLVMAAAVTGKDVQDVVGEALEAELARIAAAQPPDVARLIARVEVSPEVPRDGGTKSGRLPMRNRRPA